MFLKLRTCWCELRNRHTSSSCASRLDQQTSTSGLTPTDQRATGNATTTRRSHGDQELSSAVRPPRDEGGPDVHATSIHRRASPPDSLAWPPARGRKRQAPRKQAGRLAGAQRARDLADRDRRAGPELPALRRAAQGHLRAELRAREHAGRLRRDRQHDGGARGARRPHLAARLQQPHRAGAAGTDELAGQRETDLRRDRAHVHVPVPPGRQSGSSGAHAQGTRRLRQGAAGASSTTARRASEPAGIS